MSMFILGVSVGLVFVPFVRLVFLRIDWPWSVASLDMETPAGPYYAEVVRDADLLSYSRLKLVSLDGKTWHYLLNGKPASRRHMRLCCDRLAGKRYEQEVKDLVPYYHDANECIGQLSDGDAAMPAYTPYVPQWVLDDEAEIAAKAKLARPYHGTGPR